MELIAAGCIYCGSADLNLEHGIPRGLGRFKGYEGLSDRVCKRCNSALGLLDDQLCHSSLFREYLGIKGRKSHKKVNPFYRGSAGAKPIELAAVSHEHGKPPIALELVDGTLRDLRQAAIMDGDGQEYVIPIQDQMTPEHFRKRFDTLGINSIQQLHITCDENELERIRTLLATLVTDVTFRRDDQQPSPATYTSAAMTLNVTSRYVRAIAKIAFHCFLGLAPRFRGDEGCFSEIRQFIRSEDSPDNWERFVSLERAIYGGLRPVNWGHLVTADIDYMRLTSRVQLFLGPEWHPPLFTIEVDPKRWTES